MKRYSISWTVIITENDEISEKLRTCDVIASNFAKAIEWLNNNRKDFELKFVSSVYSYSDINIAE